MSKQKIHIWKGQSGTMCLMSHIPQEDGFVWLSKMNTAAAVNINCDKCWNTYRKKKEIERCSCGHPQSYPIPHEHDQTDREKAIIKHFQDDPKRASAPQMYEALKGDALDEALRELNKEKPDLWRLKRLLEYKKELQEQAIAAAEGKN